MVKLQFNRFHSWAQNQVKFEKDLTMNTWERANRRAGPIVTRMNGMELEGTKTRADGCDREDPVTNCHSVDGRGTGRQSLGSA